MTELGRGIAKMLNNKDRKTIVIGHKNPDTDSICSAIAYANYKTAVTGSLYMPARAGHVNPETQYVLDYFKVDAPELVDNVKTQVNDIGYRETSGIAHDTSLKQAWSIMQKNNVVTLPITEGERLEGLITVGDITKAYMDVYDSRIIATARTPYSNIMETIEGDMVVGSPEGCFSDGKVRIAAANPDMMEYYIEEHDLVILGNRYESQLCAIEMKAGGIIVCEGAGVSMTIRKLAQERGCTVICTPYDTYTVARLINQSMPVSHFMKTDHLVTFELEDYVDEIKDIMASKRFRDFPVLDKVGRYKGMISRRNLLGAKGKQIILVDHNEKSQAVEGMEGAEILEIIDHHRLGTVETISPVFFRNQPLGCTATIVYQMYHESGIEIEKHIAGLLCGAIISDTLLFRSPTCTEVDKLAAMDLAQIAGIDPEKFAVDMFSAGSDLRQKSDEEIFYQDFKRFSAGKVTFGVGQINSLNVTELRELKGRMMPYLEKIYGKSKLDMVFFMLTSILEESTELLCVGQGTEQLLSEAFHIECEDGSAYLPGVVSRKKQLIPALVMALQQ